MKPRLRQRPLPILLLQDRLIPQRHLRQNTLKRRPPQGIDIPQAVLMKILTLPDPQVVGVQSAQPRDVDVKTRTDIDPAGVDYV